ncbi:hypothetical protein Tco_0080913, partial [Tanacetum coccineum]
MTGNKDQLEDFEEFNGGSVTFGGSKGYISEDSEEEELEAQGRKSQDDPLVSLVQGLVTPSKTTVNASGEEQIREEDIREGKAPMIIEEAPKKTKEQILQEEVGLAEAIRLDTLEKEEEAKQVHLNSLLTQRIAEEEELNEQQNKRRAQVQFEAQHYTDEDWDLNRAKIKANAKLSKTTKDSLKRFGEELQTKTSKRLKSDEAKDDESAKQTGKRRKQMARKGLHTDLGKDDSEDSDKAS